MISFRQALLKYVAPRLKTFGYDYDDALKDGNTTYGFHKHLGDNIRTAILFNRGLDQSEMARGYGFGVTLLRVRIQDIARWRESDAIYEGAVAPDLSLLLWVSYGQRIYPTVHHSPQCEADKPESACRQVTSSPRGYEY